MYIYLITYFSLSLYNNTWLIYSQSSIDRDLFIPDSLYNPIVEMGIPIITTQDHCLEEVFCGVDFVLSMHINVFLLF